MSDRFPLGGETLSFIGNEHLRGVIVDYVGTDGYAVELDDDAHMIPPVARVVPRKDVGYTGNQNSVRLQLWQSRIATYGPKPPAPKRKVRSQVLAKAESLINGERADTYGSPEESFGRIAKLWTAMGLGVYDKKALGIEPAVRPVEAADVAMALLQLKVSRYISSGSKHGDSIVDMLGYVALAGELTIDPDDDAIQL